MVSYRRNAQETFTEKPQLKTISFQTYKHRYLILTWSEKVLKGTVVILTVSSLHVGSLEITLLVP